MKYAVLIDGGFIRRKLGSQAEPTTLHQIREFLDVLRAHPALAGMTLHRIYWYDAMPLETGANRPLKGGHVDFSATALAQTSKALLNGLCTLPHVSLRRGDLVFRGWRIRKGRLPDREPSVTLFSTDLEPNIQQKGVDMRIGLDIASLTMKAHADTIVLVAGDSDFIPAMKFARREGARLYLVTLNHSVRPGMREHSDLLLDVPIQRARVRAQRESHVT